MPQLTPVSGDPFAAPAPRGPKLTPINGDPFAVKPGWGETILNALTGTTAKDREATVNVHKKAMERDATEERARTFRARMDASQHDGLLDYGADLLGRGTASFDAGMNRLGAAVNGSEAQRARARNMESIANASAPGEATIDDLKSLEPARVAQFLAEQGVQSLPQMGAAIASLPVAIASMTGQVAQQRALSDGRTDATGTDAAIALPVGVISSVLDRAGFTKAVAPGAGNAIVRLGKAGAAEGLTELGQSEIEYAGSSLGTKTGWDASTAFDQGLGGLAVGSAMGAGMHGTAEAVTAANDASMGPLAVAEASQLEAPTQSPAAPLEPVSQPFAPVKLTPVDGDPFNSAPAPRAPATPVADGPQPVTNGPPQEGADGLGVATPPTPVELTKIRREHAKTMHGTNKQYLKNGTPEAARWEEGYLAGLAGEERTDRNDTDQAFHNGWSKGLPSELQGLHWRNEDGTHMTKAQLAEYNKPAPVAPAAPAEPATLRPEAGELGEGERMVRTPAGGSIRTKFEVVDASTLTQAEGDNQNRDRSRDSTTLQVQDIISKFDPELLHEDASSDRGAPIVGPDNAIDSGNGRVLTLNKIYDEHPELAAKYRAMIEARGHSTEGLERPILIQRRATDLTPEQRRQFVIDSNKDSKLGLTNIERARSDADGLDSATMGLFRGGDVHSAANTDFVKAFHARLSSGELAAQVDANGGLSQGGIDRIEHALMARAYENPEILSKLMEARDNNIRSIGTGMLDQAGPWAKLRADIKDGAVKPEFDVTDKLVEAARRVSDIRAAGGKIGDELNQTGMFGSIDPTVEAFMRLFYGAKKGDPDPLARAASTPAIIDALSAYVRQAAAQTTGDQLFGASETTPQSILQHILDARGKPGGDMFATEDRAPAKEKDDGHFESSNEIERAQPSEAGDEAGDGRRAGGRGSESGAGQQRRAGEARGTPSGARSEAGDSSDGTGSSPSGARGSAGGAPGVDAGRAPQRDEGRDGRRVGEAPAGQGPGSGSDASVSVGADSLASALEDEADDTPDYREGRAPLLDKGAYEPSFMALSYTDRTSIFNSAAETLGLDPDKFHLLPAPRQVALLSRAMADRFGIKVDVDRGMQERFAIDQLLDAFQNVQAMAHILDLPNGAMSFGGKLTLRLQKGGNFLGQFQAGANIITLPKRSNSFSHEWGHALDFHLLDALGETGRGLSGAIRQRGAGVDKAGAMPVGVREAFVKLLNDMFFDKAETAAKIMQLEAKILATKSDKVKAATQLAIDKLTNGNSQIRDIRSAFYKNAKEFDGPGGDYWQSPTEMLARAFEAYTSYKVEAAGLTTEFIGKGDASYLEGAGSRFEKTFPKGDERARIFATFENLFGQIADEQMLGKGAGAAKPGGTTRPMTAYDKTPKVAKERNVIKAELAAIRNSVRQTAKEKAGRADDPKGAVEKLADLNGTVFMSMTGNLRMIQGRSNSPALQRLIDHLTKQDGRGDRTVRRTFGEDVHLQRTKAVNRLHNILKANHAANLDFDDTRLLRDLLTQSDGKPVAVPPGSDHIVRAAAAIRQLLDNEFYVNQAAGINLGYTRNGYLSRVLDLPKVWNDQPGFVEAAAEVYEIVFDNAFGDPKSVIYSKDKLPRFMKLARFLEKKGYPMTALPEVRALLKDLSKLVRAAAVAQDPAPIEAKIKLKLAEIEKAMPALWDEVRPAYAKERAEKWMTSINLVAGEENNAASPDSKYTKHRALPPEADKIMEKFYLSDPVESVTNYLNASARRTAYARRFGNDGAKRKALFEAMAKEGVTPDDQRTVSRILDTATGRVRSEMALSVQSAAAFVNAAGTMALLPRATISSLAEPFTAGIITGDARSGFKMLGMMIGSALGSPSGKVRNELSRAMGIISDSGADTIMEQRMGQTFADETRWDRMTSTMFRRTGLTPLTRAQVAHGTGLGHSFLDNLAGKIVNGKGGAKADAIALYRELGIRDPEAFAAELLASGRMPSIEELETPFGEDYTTAQYRFARMIVQQPDAMDRPELAQNPVGRVIYGITGFSYGYWRNVTKRTGIYLEELRKRRGGSIAALYLARVIASAAVAYLMGTTISTIREKLLNPERWEDLEEKGTLTETMAALGFTRTFSFGALDTVIQTWTGLKYQRDLSNAFIGPGPGFFLQSAQKLAMPLVKNSRKTNTAEFNAVQGTYSLASPFLAFGLARVPGGPVVDVTTGVGMAYVTSAAARDKVAKLAVGEKDTSKTRTPTGLDKFLDKHLGEVKRKERSE